MSFMELAGTTYHCRNCSAELSVYFDDCPKELQVCDQACVVQNELGEKYCSAASKFYGTQVSMFHVEDCVCADCVEKLYDSNERHISDTLSTAIGILESEINNYEATENKLAKIIAETTDGLCERYNAATDDANLMKILLAEKGIYDVGRRKRLVDKYLSDHWIDYILRVKSTCDSHSVQEVLSMKEQTSAINRDNFQEHLKGISSNVNGSSVHILDQCPVDGVVNFNPLSSNRASVATLNTSTATTDTVFYRTVSVGLADLSSATDLESDSHKQDTRELYNNFWKNFLAIFHISSFFTSKFALLSFNVFKNIDLDTLITSVVQQSKYYNTVRDGLLNELGKAYTSKS